MKNSNIELVNCSIDQRWLTDHKKRKKEKEFVNLVQFERYFGHLKRKQKAAKMGMSEGHYNTIMKLHGLNEGGRNEEIINSTICRGNVLSVWSYFIT